MTYSQKLRDPRWQKKRLDIFDRDCWKCYSCGSKDNELQVHHIVYRKIDPWDYPDHLYQTLCKDCHAIRGELVDKAADALRIRLNELPTTEIEHAAQVLMEEAMGSIVRAPEGPADWTWTEGPDK